MRRRRRCGLNRCAIDCLLPTPFPTGSAGQVVEGLDLAVMKMMEGEHALVTIPAQYAFGDQVRPCALRSSTAWLAFQASMQHTPSCACRARVHAGAGASPWVVGGTLGAAAVPTCANLRLLGQRAQQPQLPHVPVALAAPYCRPNSRCCWRCAPAAAALQDSQQPQAVVPAGSTVEYDVKLLSFVKVGGPCMRSLRGGGDAQRRIGRCPAAGCWLTPRSAL